MNRLNVVAVAVLMACFAIKGAKGQSPSKRDGDPVVAVKRTGWQLVQLVVDKLQGGDEFPGIENWRKELIGQMKKVDVQLPPDRWPTVDVDVLVSRNPNFWRAFYEIAPGDPGLALLHGGLLLTAGEATRASDLILIIGQRPGVPKEVRRVLDVIAGSGQRVGERSNNLVREGIALFDKGDFAAALKKHQEAIALWPQNGWAHYEYGLTLRQQQWAASGAKLPPNASIIVNGGPKQSPEVTAAFAKARQHDPFQLKAYQGDNPEVIAGFTALAEKGLPAWEQITKSPQRQASDDVLLTLADALQEARQDELALVTRQVIVARRKRFAPDDHPFIAKSLRRIAPGEATEATLARLAGGRLAFRQLIAPE